MERSEIKTVVTEFLSGLSTCSYGSDDIQEGHNLRDDLGVDSLDFVELVMLCEKEFNIGIPDWAVAEKENCSVGEFIDLVESYIR